MSSTNAPWHRIGDLAVQVPDTEATDRAPRLRTGRHLESVPTSEAVRWLSAYALGLAYSSLPDREAVRLLCRATRTGRELAGAQAQLREWTVIDSSRQQRALRLLTNAAQRDDVALRVAAE